MLNLFKRKEDVMVCTPNKPQVITVWSPAGGNTANFSLQIGQDLASYTSVAIVELPCLGIPRLGIVSDIMDREKCTELALQEFEKKGEIDLSQLHHKADNLALLPASVYATPDYLLNERLSLETLIDFPAKFINTARQQGYNTILFECQGQLTSPMTFFALKNADYIFLVVPEADDLAFTLINVKRLIQVFRFPLEKFCLVGEMDPLTLTDLAVVKDEEGKTIGHLAVIAPQTSQVAELLWPGITRHRPEAKKTSAMRLFGRTSPVAEKHAKEKDIDSTEDEELTSAARKIRL